MNNKNKIKPVPKNLLPAAFEFSMGPDIANNYYVTWLPDLQMIELRIDGYVNFVDESAESNNPYIKRVKVSASQWRVFWAVLEHIKAWGWGPQYSNVYILDGSSWGLNIKYRGKKLKSQGCNAVPGYDDQSIETNDSFILLIAALNMLLGGDYIPENVLP